MGLKDPNRATQLPSITEANKLFGLPTNGNIYVTSFLMHI